MTTQTQDMHRLDLIGTKPKPTGLMAALQGQNAVRWGLRIISFVFFFSIWEWYGRLPDTFAVAPPSEVFAALWDGLVSGELIEAGLGTVQTMVTGYAIAITLGITIGMFIAMTSWGRNTVEPIVNALYAAPMSLLIPIIGIYIGLGFSGRLFIVVTWSVFVIIVNTATGFRSTPPELLEMAQAFRANRASIFTKIIFPSALPYVLVGLRLGAGRAIRGAVTAEILLGVTNIGKYLIGAGSTYNMPKLLAGILFVVILGLIVMETAEWLEKRILEWRHY